MIRNQNTFYLTVQFFKGKYIRDKKHSECFILIALVYFCFSFYRIYANRPDHKIHCAGFLSQLPPGGGQNVFAAFSVSARHFIGISFSVLTEYPFPICFGNNDRKLKQFTVFSLMRLLIEFYYRDYMGKFQVSLQEPG